MARVFHKVRNALRYRCVVSAYSTVIIVLKILFNYFLYTNKLTLAIRWIAAGSLLLDLDRRYRLL